MNDISWASLATPAGLGLVVALIMGIVWKPLVLMLMVYIPDTIPGGVEQKDRMRGLLVMLGCYALCLFFAMWRMGWVWQEGFPLSMASLVFATTEYEVVKNVIGAAGGRIPAVKLF